MILKTFAMAVLAALANAVDFTGTVTEIVTENGVVTITATIEGETDPVTAEVPADMPIELNSKVEKRGDQWFVDDVEWTPTAAAAGDSGEAAAGDSGEAAAGDSGEAAAGDSGEAAAGDSGEAAAGDSGEAAAGDSGEAAAGDSGEAAAGDSGEAADGGSEEAAVVDDNEYGSNLFGLENAFSTEINVQWPGVDGNGDPILRDMGTLTLANGWGIGEGADAFVEFFVMLHFSPTEAEKAAFETMTFSWAMSGYVDTEVDGEITTVVDNKSEVMQLFPTFIPGDDTVIFDYDYAVVDAAASQAFDDPSTITWDKQQMAFGDADGTDEYVIQSSATAEFTGLFKPDPSRSRFNSETNELQFFWKREGSAGQAFDLGEDVLVAAFLGVEADRSVAAKDFVIESDVLFPLERPACASDEVRLENLECGCDVGKEKVDGTCVAECAVDEERVDGSCVAVCAENEARGEDGECALDCSTDEEELDGACVAACAEGEERLDGTCVASCGAGQERVAGACVAACGAGQERVDGICSESCAEGQTRTEAGECVVTCEEGKEANAAAECVDVCAADESRNDAGECVKKEGATSVTTFALTSVAAIATLMY